MSIETTPGDGSDTPASFPPAPALPPTRPAGFWRRVAAFIIDGVIIGMVGLVVGLVFESGLSRMGGYERFVGFVIVLAYAGLLNSRLGNGQTMGKRLLSIRTRGIDGSLLSVPRTMARQSVFAIPFFLNGAPFSESVLMSFGGVIISLLMLGGLFSIIYLFVFNRRTRRSLHDYVVGSWVVRDGELPPDVPPSPLWRGHMVVVALLALLSAALPVLGWKLMNTEMFEGISEMSQVVAAEPGVLSSGVMVGTTYRSSGDTIEYVSITLHIKGSRTDDEKWARKIARKVMAAHPPAASKNTISVTLVHGFDMVIASKWSQHAFWFEPAELE